MFDRRFFLKSAPAAIVFSASLTLPHMARANIAGLLQEIEKFCAKVYEMAGLATAGFVDVPLIDSTITAASRSLVAIGIAASEVNPAELSNDQREQLRAAIRRFRSCRNQYDSLKTQLLDKIKGSGGTIGSPQLQRQLENERQMVNLNRVIQRILNQLNDENK